MSNPTTAEAAATRIEYERQSCNFFQLASVQCNIRYNAGISFPPSNKDLVASLWYNSVAQHGAHVQVGLVKMKSNTKANSPTQEASSDNNAQAQTNVQTRPLLLRQIVRSNTILNFAQPTIAKANGRNLSQLVEDNLYDENLPATGPARLFLFSTTNNDDDSNHDHKISALVVNLNAALWDAVTIKAVLETFMEHMIAACGSSNESHQYKQQSSNPPQKLTKNHLYTRLGGWEKVLQETLDLASPKQKEEENGNEPKYLPIGDGDDSANAISISKILPAAAADKPTGKDRRIAFTLDAETVAKCRTVMETANDDYPWLSLNELGVACFTRSLAEAYFESLQNSSSITKVTIAQVMQIDPRILLHDKEKEEKESRSPTTAKNNNYLHAIGALTLGWTVTREELEESGVSDAMTTEWILEESQRVAEDVQTRMQRGEGARKSLDISSGKMDQSKVVVSAVELVDHGTYLTPPPQGKNDDNDKNKSPLPLPLSSSSFEIELGHRFDQCELMSVVVHLEKGTGVLKIEAQIAKDQDRAATIQLFERIRSLWKAVAACRE